MSLKEGNLKVYDFSHVGELNTDFETRRQKERNERLVPVGIKTPIQFATRQDDTFKMHDNVVSQIKDNFRNLLQTNHGERLGLFDFGANLSELCFDFGDETTDGEAMRRILRTTQKYMPFVVLKSFSPFTERSNNQHTAKIGVRLTYDIPALNSIDNRIEVILHVAG